MSTFHLRALTPAVRNCCRPTLVFFVGLAACAQTDPALESMTSSNGEVIVQEIPDTPLARAAQQRAKQMAPAHLYNHSMRTYIFGASILRARGLEFDEETAFVASVLHDLGLVPELMSPDLPFEIDGADAAVQFLREQGADPTQVQTVWDAIALHTNAPIAQRKAPEVALVNAGAGLEATGFGYQELPLDLIAAVLEEYPRLDFKRKAVEGMIALCRQKPQGVLLHPFAEVGRRHIEDFAVPTAEDLMLSSPFEE